MANKKVTLKDGNDILYPQSVLNGVDTTNLIASGVDVKSGSVYTATQDCYIITLAAYGTVLIDGVEIYYNTARPLLPLKKGQQFTTTKSGSITANVYGILK